MENTFRSYPHQRARTPAPVRQGVSSDWWESTAIRLVREPPLRRKGDAPGARERENAGMVTSLRADYLVIGAGAAGMAFTDALVDHADVDVVMVDRRHAPGGHWLDAYPFVRLHQASAFYGVASTLLGDGSVQQDGPEAGLHERATAPEIRDYYARVLERMTDSGRVTFFGGCEYLGGRRFDVAASRCRVRRRGHARSRRRRATSPPAFRRATRLRSLPAKARASSRSTSCAELSDSPSQYVVVGIGQDGDRRVRVVARPRRRPGRDLLGPATRSVDAEPRRGAARPRDLPRHGG